MEQENYNDVLTAGRMLMRAYELEDASALYELLRSNEPRLRESFPMLLGKSKSLAAVRIFIKREAVERKNKSRFSFGIFEKKGGALIGYISVKTIDWTIPKCELAYFIDRKYEGKGMVSEALGELISWCRAGLQIKRIFLRILIHNTASRRVAEKNGFTLEGIHRRDFKTYDGELCDVAFYAIVF